MSNKWDYRFMALCHHVATWSKDPRTQVGAVLVRNRNRDVVIGYNGFPPEVRDTKEKYEDRNLKHQLVIHAERNAILTAKRDLKGYTLYCSLPPCISCACDIISAGIVRVVHPELTKEEYALHARYHSNWEFARTLYQEAMIELTVLPSIDAEHLFGRR